MEIRNKALKIATSSLIITGMMLTNQTSPTLGPLTPTTAPSKTPVKAATQTPPSSHETEPNQPDLNTQADLQILTGNIQRPNGMIWINGKLYVSCSGDWTLYEIDSSTGTTSQYLYGVKNAHTFYAETQDNQTGFWIPDFQSNTFVHIFQGTSEIIASNLSGPWGVTRIEDTTFLVTNLSDNNIVSIKTTGETQELINNLRSPTGITSDQDNIYVANAGSTRRSLEWYPIDEVISSETPIQSDETETHTLITGLQNTTNLILGPDQFLYFSYALGTRGVIGRVDPKVCIANGGCTGNEVEIVVYTELAAPLAGLTISPDMKLYVHSIFSPDLYWLQLETKVSETVEVNQ
jgi:hypothetical protein